MSCMFVSTRNVNTELVIILPGFARCRQSLDLYCNKTFFQASASAADLPPKLMFQSALGQDAKGV